MKSHLTDFWDKYAYTLSQQGVTVTEIMQVIYRTAWFDCCTLLKSYITMEEE